MTQNLRLVNKTISSDDSAMESGSFTIPSSNINNFVTSEDDAPAVYYDGNTSHGAYYDYYTATAGSGKKDAAIGDAPDSICPKGWHLPTQDEYQTLYNAYPSNGLMVDANGPKYTAFGYVYNKAVQTNTYLYSYYWGSSMAKYHSMYSGIYDAAYTLYTYTSGSSSSPYLSSSNKYYGNSIRCVAGELEVKPYSIYYDSHGIGSGGPNPNPQTGVSNTKVRINPSKPYQGGKAFHGWCSEPTDDQTCTGTVYNVHDGEAIALDLEDEQEYVVLDDINRDITLYAMWESYPTLDSSSCSTIDIPSQRTNSKTFNYNGRTISLMRFTTGKCSFSVGGSFTWSQAYSGCPSGYHLPSINECHQPGNNSYYCSVNVWTSTSAGSGQHYTCWIAPNSNCSADSSGYADSDSRTWGYDCLSN